MPRHLEPSGRTEPDDQTSVILWLQDLRGVKVEFGGTPSGRRREAPDHLAVLRRVLIDAEGFGGIVLQRESRCEGKAFVEHLGDMNPVHAEVQDRLAACWLPRH